MKHCLYGYSGILCVVMLLNCGCASKYFFYPTRTLQGNPGDLGQSYEDVWFNSLDGIRLHGWWVSAQGESWGTVIHFHGNAQNLSTHYAFVDWLPAEGYNVFVFDYRGYGQSDGRPSRSGAVKDSRAALREGLRRAGESGQPVFVLGQSLGGAMVIRALELEDSPNISGMVIDSAFSSYRRIVRENIGEMAGLKHIRGVLSKVVISDRDAPDRAIAHLEAIPLLLMHGTDDRIVPYHHGEILYDAAPGEKSMITIPKGRHLDALGARRDEYAPALLEFFSRPGENPALN